MNVSYVIANIFLGEKLVRSFVGRNDDLEDLLIAYTEVLSAFPESPQLSVCVLNDQKSK